MVINSWNQWSLGTGETNLVAGEKECSSSRIWCRSGYWGSGKVEWGDTKGHWLGFHWVCFRGVFVLILNSLLLVSSLATHYLKNDNVSIIQKWYFSYVSLNLEISFIVVMIMMKWSVKASLFELIIAKMQGFKAILASFKVTQMCWCQQIYTFWKHCNFSLISSDWSVLPRYLLNCGVLSKEQPFTKFNWLV